MRPPLPITACGRGVEQCGGNHSGAPGRAKVDGTRKVENEVLSSACMPWRFQPIPGTPPFRPTEKDSGYKGAILAGSGRLADLVSVALAMFADEVPHLTCQSIRHLALWLDLSGIGARRRRRGEIA